MGVEVIGRPEDYPEDYPEDEDTRPIDDDSYDSVLEDMLMREISLRKRVIEKKKSMNRIQVEKRQRRKIKGRHR